MQGLASLGCRVAPADRAAGLVCPRCGGALWTAEHQDDSPTFEPWIGDAVSAAESWVAHCAMRNTALKRAGRALVENAALARRLAAWTGARGNQAAADNLEREALDDDRRSVEVGRMLEGASGLDDDASEELRIP